MSDTTNKGVWLDLDAIERQAGYSNTAWEAKQVLNLVAYTRRLSAERDELLALADSQYTLNERLSDHCERYKAQRDRERERVATLEDGVRRIADHADNLTHLPATVIAPDLRDLLDDHDKERDR